MSARNIPNTNEELATGCVVGLFHDDSSAEIAMNRLKDADFSQSEIGVATTAEGGKHSGFWDKLSGLFGKREHVEPVAEFDQSLEFCGLPEEQANYFNQALDEGDVLLTVHASGERATRAREILQAAGADIGAGAVSNLGTRAGTIPTTPVRRERRIELLGEILRVHKERVQRGEVRLRKEVVVETQHVEVPVSREELVIERTPGLGREATGQPGMGEKEIRVPLSEEQVHVEKKPVVNEEVRVGTKQVQDTKRIDDTVRHEELRTDREGKVEIPDEEDKGKPAA